MILRMKYIVISLIGIFFLIPGSIFLNKAGWFGITGVDDAGLHWEKKSQDFEVARDPILDHTLWDELLKKHVTNNGDVNYKAFVKDKKNLEKYLGYLSQNPAQKSWPVSEQFAYYINLYNAGTTLLIVQNYPVASIKDIKRPWHQKFIMVGDKTVSLNTIEHGILRKMNDPRIHFAINCASISCPRLLNEAFTSEKLETQLQKLTAEFINSDKNKIAENKVELSKIFDWFKKDFPNKDLVSYINIYSDVKVNKNADVDYMDYDWRLNEQ